MGAGGDDRCAARNVRARLRALPRPPRGDKRGDVSTHTSQRPRLQNHPGERDFPVRPGSLLRAFQVMSRRQEIVRRLLVLVAILCGGVALIAYGITTDSPTPPRAGYVFAAAMAAVALASVAGVVALGRRAARSRVEEQETYYRLGRFEVLVDRPHLEALQLDGVNAAAGWTETLESWPARVRFPARPPGFRTFSLLPPEEAKIQLDQDWGVLSADDYRRTVASLFAGLHSLQFLAVARSEHGARTLERVARLVELPPREVLAVLDATHGPARLLWAWDLWRIIPLTRNAFMAGLVTEQDAWSHILRASAIVHALFEDLRAYHQNLRIGHAFWCDDYAATRARREVLEAFERNDPPRPIREVSWTRLALETLPPHVLSAGRPLADAAGQRIGAV